MDATLRQIITDLVRLGAEVDAAHGREHELESLLLAQQDENEQLRQENARLKSAIESLKLTRTEQTPPKEPDGTDADYRQPS